MTTNKKSNKDDGWQVIFQKKNGEINVFYTGNMNLYEFFGVLEIERETLKERLVKKVK